MVKTLFVRKLVALFRVQAVVSELCAEGVERAGGLVEKIVHEHRREIGDAVGDFVHTATRKVGAHAGDFELAYGATVDVDDAPSAAHVSSLVAAKIDEALGEPAAPPVNRKKVAAVRGLA